jgi:hypothetical protein
LTRTTAPGLIVRILKDFKHEFLLWAVFVFEVDEDEARQAILWTADDQRLQADMRVAIKQALVDATPAGAAQVLDALCWGDASLFRKFIIESAQRLLRERREEELQTMPYREYLRTPEWREKAEATYGRFDHRCAFCNSSGDLHAHHRTYDRRGRELPGDLTAVCPSCHAVLHEWRALAPV